MSIKKNYLYYSINRVIKILIAVISVPYVSRTLGATKIGIYSYTYTIASYFVLFIILGLDFYGNREIAKCKHSKEKLNKTASEIYLMQLIIGILIVIPYLIFSLTADMDYRLVLIIQSLHVFSAVIDVNWALSGLEEFKFTSIRNSLFNIIGLLLIIVLVRDDNSLIVYTIILSGLSLINNLTGWIYLRKHVAFIKVKLNDAFKHLKPNLILFIPIIAVSLYKMMDKVMMGMMSNMDQVGFYENSEKIIQIPTLLISSLGAVMLPRMTAIYSSGKTKKANKYMEKAIDMAMIISTLLCFGIMGISKEFVPFFYGNGFDLCKTLYLILLPCCIFLAFSNVIRTQYLIPKSKDRIFITAVITGACVNLIINLILIPKIGAVGAAIGTFFAEFGVCTVQAVAVRKEINIKDFTIRSLPFIILGIVMFALIYNIDLNCHIIIKIIAKTIIGAIIYAIGLVVIYSLSNDKYYNPLKNQISKLKRRH